MMRGVMGQQNSCMTLNGVYSTMHLMQLILLAMQSIHTYLIICLVIHHYMICMTMCYQNCCTEACLMSFVLQLVAASSYLQNFNKDSVDMGVPLEKKEGYNIYC